MKKQSYHSMKADYSLNNAIKCERERMNKIAHENTESVRLAGEFHNNVSSPLDTQKKDDNSVNSIKKELNKERLDAAGYGVYTMATALSLYINSKLSTNDPDIILPCILGLAAILFATKTAEHLYNSHKIKQCFNEYLR